MAIYGYTKNYKLIKPQFNTDTWHDYIYDNLDIIDAVMSAIYASGNWKGFWATNTVYTTGDVIIDQDTDTMYKVMVDHTTSETDFATEYANNPTYYELWSPNNLAESWATDTTGLVSNTDYSSKAYAISSGLIDDGSAKEWAVGTGTIGNTNLYSAKKYATDAHNDYISMTTDVNVVAVGSNIASVNAVAGISSAVSTVANKITEVDTVAWISNDVSTVAGIQNAVSNVSNIQSAVLNVSDDRANVNLVALNINNVNNVGNDIANVNTVGNDITNVNTVATNISDVNTAAANMTAIQNAPSAASNAASSATLAQEWATKMDGQVASTDYSSKYYAGQSANSATASATSATSSENWATKTDAPVNGNDYSAKWWALQANAERRIGQLVPSTIPLSDAGLHLADGSLISGSGSYGAFVDYMAGLVSTNPDLFETEANWQSAVTTYGVCGKYVYDSVNNTIRLPKLEGFIEGTNTTTAVGDIASQVVKLPDLTGRTGHQSNTAVNAVSGVFYNDGASIDVVVGTTHQASSAVAMRASRVSSVYSGNGTDTTIHPQATKILYYVVIATSVKTDIQVDIDQIASDLNGKADVDLINTISSASSAFKSAVFEWGMPDYSAGIDYTSSWGTDVTAPSNGIVLAHSLTTNSGGTYIRINGAYFSVTGVAASSPAVNSSQWLPVKKGDLFTCIGGIGSGRGIYFYPVTGG